MTGYTLSRVAQADLKQIWDYTLDRWNAEQAEAYLREVERAIERAAADPRIGRAIDYIRQGYFRLTAGSHMLIYRIIDDGTIDVVRVLHQRMDIDRHL